MANVAICLVRDNLVVLRFAHMQMQCAKAHTMLTRLLHSSIAAVGMFNWHVQPLHPTSAGYGVSSDYHDTVHVQVLLSSPLVITSQAQPWPVPKFNPQTAGNPSFSPQLAKMGLSRSGHRPQLSASTSRRVLQAQLGGTTFTWP